MTPIPDYADVITIEDFKEAVLSVAFVNDDGSGYYATATEEDRNSPAIPSEIKQGRIAPVWATHVAWYNK